MVSQAGRTSRIAASLLIVVNLIVMVSSSFLFAVGLWIIASPTTLFLSLESTGSVLLKALLPQEVLSLPLGVGLVGVGTFVLFVSIMGFYGALTRSPFLLFMYSTLVLLLLLLECALLYYFSSSLIEKGLQRNDGQWTHALRLAFHCCEHNASFDSQRPPWSCCGPGAYSDSCTISNAYKKRCNETIESWLDKYQSAIYAGLTALHVVLSSCALLRRRT